KLPDGTVLPVGGKTGTGDNRINVVAAGGQRVSSKVMNRTASFVFLVGGRFYGTVIAFVPGEQARNFEFTSALPVQIWKTLAPRLEPLLAEAMVSPGPAEAVPVSTPSATEDGTPSTESPASEPSCSGWCPARVTSHDIYTLAAPGVAELLVERFRSTGPFRRLDSCLRGDESSEKPIWLRGLSGSSRALLLASLARDLSKEIFVVAPDMATAEDLKEDLQFLLGRGSAAIFPESGLDPYHARHPRISTRAARIELLASLADPVWRRALPACERLQVILVTAVSLITPVPPPAALARNVHRIKVGEAIDPDTLMDLLIGAGFEPAHMVSEYGEVSRRGGILDVYSFGRANPVRIEFDADEVASIREFDPYAQRSTGEI